MDMYPQFKSVLGYQNGKNKIDSYGVDHSNFSLRDEIEYQTARTERENTLINQYNKQGITNNYPQFGTNFWGNSSNNYGFGTSNIADNINTVLNQINTLIPEKNTVDYSLYGNDFSKEYIDKMLADSNFQQALKRTKYNEGEYVNHPNDNGGETNYGISSRAYPNENIKKMTPERASAIFYRDYWIGPKINKLPNSLAGIVFDDGVVQGQPTAIINLQKALNVPADGIIGPITLKALQISNHDIVKENFIKNVHKTEDQYLKNNPSQQIFEKGHRKRFNNY